MIYQSNLQFDSGTHDGEVLNNPLFDITNVLTNVSLDVKRVNGKIEIEPYTKILPYHAFITKIKELFSLL